MPPAVSSVRVGSAGRRTRYQVAEKSNNLNEGGRMKNADVLNCGRFVMLFILPSTFFLQPGGFSAACYGSSPLGP
jgi:hypothetical protein